MMSKNPESAPSVVLGPTSTNTVDTPVAMPTVYWISRFCEQSYYAVTGPLGRVAYGFKTCISEILVVNGIVNEFGGKRSVGGDVRTKCCEKSR